MLRRPPLFLGGRSWSCVPVLWLSPSRGPCQPRPGRRRSLLLWQAALPGLRVDGRPLLGAPGKTQVFPWFLKYVSLVRFMLTILIHRGRSLR